MENVSASGIISPSLLQHRSRPSLSPSVSFHKWRTCRAAGSPFPLGHSSGFSFSIWKRARPSGRLGSRSVSAVGYHTATASAFLPWEPGDRGEAEAGAAGDWSGPLSRSTLDLCVLEAAPPAHALGPNHT